MGSTESIAAGRAFVAELQKQGVSLPWIAERLTPALTGDARAASKTIWSTLGSKAQGRAELRDLVHERLRVRGRFGGETHEIDHKLLGRVKKDPGAYSTFQAAQAARTEAVKKYACAEEAIAGGFFDELEKMGVSMGWIGQRLTPGLTGEARAASGKAWEILGGQAANRGEVRDLVHERLRMRRRFGGETHDIDATLFKRLRTQPELKHEYDAALQQKQKLTSQPPPPHPTASPPMPEPKGPIKIPKHVKAMAGIGLGAGALGYAAGSGDKQAAAARNEAVKKYACAEEAIAGGFFSELDKIGVSMGWIGQRLTPGLTGEARAASGKAWEILGGQAANRGEVRDLVHERLRMRRRFGGETHDIDATLFKRLRTQPELKHEYDAALQQKQKLTAQPPPRPTASPAMPEPKGPVKIPAHVKAMAGIGLGGAALGYAAAGGDKQAAAKIALSDKAKNRMKALAAIGVAGLGAVVLHKSLKTGVSPWRRELAEDAHWGAHSEARMDRTMSRAKKGLDDIQTIMSGSRPKPEPRDPLTHWKMSSKTAAAFFDELEKMSISKDMVEKAIGNRILKSLKGVVRKPAAAAGKAMTENERQYARHAISQIQSGFPKKAEMVKEAPFKSEAQRRKFYALKSKGKMDQKTINEWESETPANIPERVKKTAEDKTAISGKMIWEAAINRYLNHSKPVSEDARMWAQGHLRKLQSLSTEESSRTSKSYLARSSVHQLNKYAPKEAQDKTALTEQRILDAIRARANPVARAAADSGQRLLQFISKKKPGRPPAQIHPGSGKHGLYRSMLAQLSKAVPKTMAHDTTGKI